MRDNKENIEQAKHFFSQIKRMAAKYKDKDFSDSERDKARMEIRMFNEQLDNFSIGFGDNFPGDMKTEMLDIISDIKKFSANISNNIEEGVPASHYL